MSDRFGLPLEDGMPPTEAKVEELRGTGDRGPRVLATKFLYAVANRFGDWTLTCRDMGFRCEWVYPYGWVPEAGCPWHD